MNKKYLLPPGFRDDLSPIVEREHSFTNKIISIFNSNGYLMVKPPLLEFLNKKDKNNKIFLIQNKKNKNKLKIRNDITMQVARISSSRLKNLPRPLRLCYYGEVVRNDVSILRPERQFLQIGAECIGENSYLADIEILILTFKSLDSVGIKDISIDFSSPIFLNYIINNLLIDNRKKDFLIYFKRKDINKALSFLKDKSHIRFIKNIIRCRGSINKKEKILKDLRINEKASKEIDRILKIYNFIKNKYKKININIDFTESRSHDYYSGINFTVFSKNVRGEIASGGRYKTNLKNGETATGFTCYMDTILRASHKIQKEKRIMIKFNTSAETIKKLIEKKFIIERYFQSQEDIFKLALKKKCSHILRNNKIELIK